MIRIEIESETKHGIFRDAILLPDDHTLTEAEIETMKAARITAWVDFLDNPPPEPPPEVDVAGSA